MLPKRIRTVTIRSYSYNTNTVQYEMLPKRIVSIRWYSNRTNYRIVSIRCAAVRYFSHNTIRTAGKKKTDTNRIEMSIFEFFGSLNLGWKKLDKVRIVLLWYASYCRSTNVLQQYASYLTIRSVLWQYDSYRRHVAIRIVLKQYENNCSTKCSLFQYDSYCIFFLV